MNLCMMCSQKNIWIIPHIFSQSAFCGKIAVSFLCWLCNASSQRDTDIHVETQIQRHAHVHMHAYHSTHSLRSSNTNLLFIPFVGISFGTCHFRVAAPTICNSLPPALWMCTSLDTFHCHLKTHYFQQALQLQPTLRLPLAPQIGLQLTTVYVYKLYLLTNLLSYRPSVGDSGV